MKKKDLEDKLLKKYIEDVEFYLTCELQLHILDDYYRCYLFKIHDTSFYAILADEGNGYMQVIEIVDEEKAEELRERVDIALS